MTVSEYVIRLSDLARHVLALVATVRDRVRRFIEGLNPNIRFSMARELEIDIAYQQVVVIARRLEGMLTQDREEREANRSRESSIYSGTRALVPACHGRGYVSRPIHLAFPASSGLTRLEWRGTLDYVPSRVVSFLKDQQMVEKRCDAYLAYVRDVSVDTPTVESVPVVRDYPDVFPADLPVMPPDIDI
ncbi:uncharacterized protein [Nicotiana tomentosiformis]|uniref:uncharacterized protein n=1 Tax=Nicotiana tomentosiformis TaxID=4098 RepID=UPI00388C815D